MKKERKLWYWSLALVGFEALVFLYSYFFDPAILTVEVIFLVLGVLATIFLTEILMTWMMILSFGLAVVFLVAGVVYVPFSETLVLLFSFPILLGILSKVHYYLYKHAAKVQGQEANASSYYQKILKEASFNKDETVQALLIHWSHEEQFFQLEPKEYNRMISRLYNRINKELSRFEQLFYVSEGNFFIVTSDKSRQLLDYYRSTLADLLKEYHFNGESSDQAIQLQSGYLEINSENQGKFGHYEDMISNLKRQLETDIIVEY